MDPSWHKRLAGSSPRGSRYIESGNDSLHMGKLTTSWLNQLHEWGLLVTTGRIERILKIIWPRECNSTVKWDSRSRPTGFLYALLYNRICIDSLWDVTVKRKCGRVPQNWAHIPKGSARGQLLRRATWGYCASRSITLIKNMCLNYLTQETFHRNLQGYTEWSTNSSLTMIIIQGGPKVRRQTATTHGGGLGESFEVGNPCPETHRYAPVSTFLGRMNVRLATSHSSGQRARSGMRFSFVSFHA